MIEYIARSIPSFGFVNDPEQRRGALSNKLDAMEHMLQVNNTFGAAQKLKFDIRDKIEKWVVDYLPQNSLQLSKGFILNLLDRTISRLSV